MKEQWAIFLLAVQFLTRLPVPADRHYTPARLAEAVRYYPLVGALVGAAGALVYALAALVWPHAVAVLLALAALLLVTGGFHEDGLADTFDGIGGGADRERTLAIMRDSRLGSFGVLALVSVLALKAAVLIALPPALVMAGLVAAHTLSRASAILVIATSRYARDSGIAKPVAEGVSIAARRIVALMALLCWLALAPVAGPVGLIGVLVLLAASHVFTRRLFEARIGGYTGDTLGAVQQMGELAVLLGLLAWAG